MLTSSSAACLFTQTCCTPCCRVGRPSWPRQPDCEMLICYSHDNMLMVMQYDHHIVIRML